MALQSVTPFLWFDGHAFEAAKLYTSIFQDGSIDPIDGDAESAMSVTFRINGREFIAFNGGPEFSFTPAVSLFVSVETQAEVDELWDKFITSGGEPQRCGWVTDKFGMSWQIVPTALGEMLRADDRAKADRAMQAMLGMTKIDVEAMRRAFDGD